MLDAGGARMRERDLPMRYRVPTTSPRPKPEATVTVHVTETHDGEACDCIEEDMTLRVGQEVELTHVCHDGRVDKVVARVTAITPAAPEHGAATTR